MKFTVKDSGKRKRFKEGMVRDTQDGKPRYDLIPKFALKRWAIHMAYGAAKYSENNWTKAKSLEAFQRFKASAFRHLIQLLEGNRDEDHMSACFFNIAAMEYVRNRLGNKFKDIPNV